MSIAEINAPETATESTVVQTSQDFANELQSKVFAIELSTNRFGRSRQIAERHRDGVSAVLETEKGTTTTSKKLYPPTEPYTKRVNSVLNEASATWQRMTIGYRKGVRLLKREHLKDFIREMEAISAELDAALLDLDAHRDEVIDNCREWLGDKIFDINQYPESYVGHVRVTWSVYNFAPSEDLLQMAPETYERERQLVSRRFEAAVAAFEEESLSQLAKLIDALLAKLNPEDGKKVVFTESATTNLREFFDRFKTLGVSNNEQLAELIGDAEAALGGTTMGQLKKSASKRRAISETFSKVQSQLDSLIVNAPSRAIDINDLD